jgi:hypothetical protein
MLLVVAALLVWTVIVMRDTTNGNHHTARLCDAAGAASLVAAAGILVASGLLATVPLTTVIGNITDDPGIDPPVQAGIAQAGTVVLLTSMIAVGVTFVLVAHLGYANGAVARWVVATAWLVAVALLLGVSIALLFPAGIWAIALGLAWQDPQRDRPQERP